MTERPDRAYWALTASRLARPILGALARRELKTAMPTHDNASEWVAQFAPLEAFGRLVCGIAPWLELDDDGAAEGKVRTETAALTREAIDSATDPKSPDRMNFGKNGQPLVDAAFLVQGILRAPRQLWEKLDPRVRKNLIDCLLETRVLEAGESNWLLFPAMIEAGLSKFGRVDWDRDRVGYALRRHEEWYRGDGAYGDGPDFRWDYYNSFVIQPMLLDILRAIGPDRHFGPPTYETALARSRRWAAVQERLISPEGTFPPIGRSIVYRFGAFQSLAQVALMKQLPDELLPAQVRCALTAVIHRLIDPPGTFDESGWLNIGLAGRQPSLGERYISRGSVYLCSVGLLPLGLPACDPFWIDPPALWTSQQAWAGKDLAADKALKEHE